MRTDSKQKTEPAYRFRNGWRFPSQDITTIFTETGMNSIHRVVKGIVAGIYYSRCTAYYIIEGPYLCSNLPVFFTNTILYKTRSIFAPISYSFSAIPCDG